MTEFSKIHKFDTRETFNEKWDIFIKSNKVIIDTENERLTEMGYKGDIYDKMYKSVKYYFKNKTDCKEKKPIKRKSYVSVGT